MQDLIRRAFAASISAKEQFVVEHGETLERVSVFDEYRGEGVPAGSRSLAWRLTFRHPERTLRDKEIEGRRAQLLKALQQELGIVVRTG